LLRISNGNRLIETPLIREQDYLIKGSCSEWERILEIGYINIIVEFVKSGFAYLLIRKCYECNKYYLDKIEPKHITKRQGWKLVG
jgi:hypothetical protein